MTSDKPTSLDAALLLQLDHVVLAVHDLVHASEDFCTLGFTVTPGGQHAGRSSRNALVAFEDGTYLELIAWRTPAPEERWWNTLQLSGDGLVDHALLPTSIGPALAAAQMRGLDGLRGPFPGGRARPDGTLLEWETARHDTADVPFLCADLTSRALRVPSGAARQHANGVTGIASVAVTAHDFVRSSRRWEALLGPNIPLNEWPSAGGLRRCGYTLSTTHFELFGLDATASGAPTSENLSSIPEAARQRLLSRDASNNDGPFALRLNCPGPPRFLDLARCHGALICLGTT